MKKLFTIAFLTIGVMVNAQNNGLRFVQHEYFTASISIDPGASVKEKGLNLIAEAELVSYWGYAKISIQEFTALEGGYLDYCGGFGVNVTSGYFDQWRGYGGIRLGMINRGGNPYPLVGAEGGLDIQINESLYIKLSGTADYRTDKKFSGAEPDFEYSGHLGIGTRF